MSALTITEAGLEHLDEVAALCQRAFVNPEATYFERTMRRDPHADEATTLVGWEDDQMVASTRIFWRRVRWGAGELRCGGIGNVATDPDHQGRGHAMALMRRAVEVMEERGFQISVLFTNIPKFYERVGYFVWEQPWWRADPSRLLFAATRGVDVRVPDLDRDLAALQALHTSFNVGHDGTVVRTEAHWGAMRRMYPNDDLLAFVAERAGEVVGHARVMRNVHDGCLRVHEISVADPDAAVTLLAGAARRCAEDSPAPLLLTLPDWPIIRQTIQVVFQDWTVEPHLAGMVRALPAGPPEAEIRARAQAGRFHFWAGDRF